MQHRKVYVDDWCLMEKICLVSAVLRLGENNWPSVCDLIKPKLQENRPWDWFTPDACEAQYKILFNECVQTQVKDESPALQIIQNLKTKCKIECQRKDEQRNKYLMVKKKIENLLKNGIENELIDKYYEDVQREKKEREENLRRHQEALKRRETLKMEFEKSNVPRTPNKQETKADGGSSPIVTSPLLSSLLNNPPAVQYRPTLSTSSFIPTKSSQSMSKSSSFEKLQSFSSDTSYKDNFSAELAEQINSLDRQAVPVASTSSSVIKKSESDDLISAMSVVTGTRTVGDSGVSRVQTTAVETAPKPDPQNLENLVLISPNEEEYLTEVDIPPEALLEVIGDLKEGTISLDKLIRDLEATDEGGIIDKDLTTVSIPMEESYNVDTKPPVPVSFAPEITTQVQPTEEIKTETVEECKIEVDEVEVQPSNLPSADRDKLNVDDEVIIIEDTSREEHEIRTTETEDIANIEINNIDIPVTRDESPSSVSSTVAISVEFDSSFSEQKSDNETIEAPAVTSVSNKISESEIEEDTKSKPSKPVVVIKRIEDGTGHSSRNKKNRNRIPIEESIKEIENITTDVDETHTVNKSPPAHHIEVVQQEVIEENREILREPDTKIIVPVFDEKIMENEIDTNEAEKQEEKTKVERTEPPSNADDSDVSDKFEDALQTQPEEANETCVTENIVNVETEVKSSPYADVDESFELNVSEETPTEDSVAEEKQVVEVQSEQAIVEQGSQVVINETENLKPSEPEMVEIIPTAEPNAGKNATPDETRTIEVIPEIVEENKKSDDVKPLPTKIIKSSKRKRKSTSETNDGTAEMSIVIPTVALKEIETLDSDIEQTFAPVHPIKIEPSDLKPEDEKKEQREEPSVVEKHPSKESIPTRIKTERRDTKTPEPVVMVLRRSNNKTQSPLKKIDRESRSSTDNSELMKTRKKSILLAHNRLMTHKYANAFQKPITNRQVQGYENVIYKPMDLHTIKKKIDNKQISTVAEFQRDILLMLNNAKMFNRINSQVYNMAVEVEEEALLNIQLTVQNLGEGVLSKVQKNSEKIRKRQSLENTRKDLKLIKRIKYSTKDDSFTSLPIKKPKLEENEDE